MKRLTEVILSVAAFSALALGAFQPLADEDFLEPSIQNEVAHAISRAPQDILPRKEWPGEFSLYAATNDFFSTNNLSATAIAIRLVSEQKEDGRWYRGTNDITQIAVDILQSL